MESVVKYSQKVGYKRRRILDSEWKSPRKRALEACTSGDAKALQELLLTSNSAVRGYIDGRSRPLLHVACKHGHLPCVRLLLKASAKINARQSNQATPLMLAVGQGHEDCVRELLALKADVEQQSSPPFMFDDGGEPFVGTAIFSAVDAVNERMVRLLVEEGRASVNTRCALQQSPLYVACERGYLGIVRYLISRRATVDNVVSAHTNYTMFQTAAAHAHYPVARYLLSKDGGNYRICDHEAKALLGDAAETGDTQLLKFLVDVKVDVNLKKSPSVLQVAIWEGDAKMVRQLLMAKAELTLPQIDSKLGCDQRQHTEISAAIATVNVHLGNVTVKCQNLSKRWDIVQQLLDAKAQLSREADVCQLVRCATLLGRKKTLKTILRRKGVGGVTLSDKVCENLLIWSVAQNRILEALAW
eukprot:CAMPEP_0167762506 /NCGR_PEP_ID=MMETSP0110_2-20121227/12809_1 /TAXON_ID=629695 /ORGANISM="Gymnochlora sp., Strain CCMP2014" /LENGTH=415 /DNA_ID=CAMNT_0007649395 /DNA_START=33 /DNA_END=1277 /DNA_ORIENTATION=-